MTTPFVGLPDLNLDPGRCAYSAHLDTARCRAPADTHLKGESPWGPTALVTCDTHEPIARASLTGDIEAHVYGPGCHSHDHVWCGDHCEPDPDGATP